MFADHSRDIGAGRGEVRGIGTEVDRGLTEYLVHFGRPFDDRRQMRMVVSAQATRCRDGRNLFETAGQSLVVVAAQTVKALRAAAHDQMLRAEIRCGVRDARDARKLLVENIGKDEICAGIGGQKFDAGGGQRRAERAAAPVIVEQIAIEEFDPRIAERADLGDRPFHVAEGAIRQFGDRGDAHCIAAKRAPAIGVVGEFRDSPRCWH